MKPQIFFVFIIFIQFWADELPEDLTVLKYFLKEVDTTPPNPPSLWPHPQLQNAAMETKATDNGGALKAAPIAYNPPTLKP